MRIRKRQNKNNLLFTRTINAKEQELEEPLEKEGKEEEEKEEEE